MLVLARPVSDDDRLDELTLDIEEGMDASGKRTRLPRDQRNQALDIM